MLINADMKRPCKPFRKVVLYDALSTDNRTVPVPGVRKGYQRGKAMMQRHEVIKKIMQQYAERTPITKRGITILYDRAASRGYNSLRIFIGLKRLFVRIIFGKSTRRQIMTP